VKIRNISPLTREIADTGQIVEAGHQVDIEDDQLARSLVKQTDVWESVKPAKSSEKES
jgi:hypothetical protein